MRVVELSFCRSAIFAFFLHRCWGAARDAQSAAGHAGRDLKSLELIGVDTEHFSGLPLRRGGVSAGLSAKVQQPDMNLLSGHGKGTAARCMGPSIPTCGMKKKNSSLLPLRGSFGDGIT